MAQPLSNKQEWSLANPLWANSLNPVINNPMNNIEILKNVHLANGVTVIPHKLGKLMQGWIVIDIQASALIYRSQPFNSTTLTLTSNAVVTVSLGVF